MSLITDLGNEFIKNLDPNLKYFCNLIRKELRREKDCVIAITGYPGNGKSNNAAIIGALIDHAYNFEKNICFIPTSSQIKENYMKLKMYSVLHIDEASRGLHKQKWHDKVQQTLNLLYDTEREGHYLCTLLLMPRFQNFTENFRNFRIKYWINVIDRGLCIVYKRDEDKDSKDPWHIDENYKLKEKRWKTKKIFERDIPSQVRMEQYTKNYWFYFKIPVVPKEIWKKYQELKIKSRDDMEEDDFKIESYRDRLRREKFEKWKNIKKYLEEGKTYKEIGVLMGVTSTTIRTNVKEMETYERLKGNIEDEKNVVTNKSNVVTNKSNVVTNKSNVVTNSR